MIIGEIFELYYLILAKKSLTSKRMIEMHSSFVNGWLNPEVEVVQVLDDTGGFGSTRKNCSYSKVTGPGL